MGFRLDRGLVSALAVNCGREKKLPQHTGPVSRRFESDDSRTDSFNYHGRIQVLRKSHRTSLWGSMCLWPGDQDTQERSRGQGRAKSRNRGRETETSATELGGRLEDHIELFRCFYNFIRPHRALKFGREFRTPAWQAGLTNRALTLREVFSSKMVFLELKNLLFKTLWAVSFRIPAVRLAA